MSTDPRRGNFADQTVVVTGGSAGLGLSVARAFRNSGANVALVARDSHRLEHAVAELSESARVASPPTVLACSADVTQDAEVASAIQKIKNVYGSIHVLVNAVGISDRAAILDVGPARFQQAWELNFLSAVRCTRAVASELIGTAGHLVNIGSLASKVASPYLGTYPPTKFALAAYTQQLRFELGEKGVHVLLVCPGPISRPDAGQRYDRQADNLPPAVRRPGGGAKLKQIDSCWLAQQIVTACQRRSVELVVPSKVRWLAALAQVCPAWADRIILRKTVQPDASES